MKDKAKSMLNHKVEALLLTASAMMSNDSTDKMSDTFMKFVATHNNGYWQEALMWGYTLRVAEEKMSKKHTKINRKLLKQFESSGNPQDAQSEPERLAYYLDAGHDSLGLGGKAEGYTILPLQSINNALELLVAFFLDREPPSDDEMEFVTEMFFRCLDEGYLFRLAECILV